MTIDKIMTTAPVIPVLSIKDAEKAVPLAKALVSGGLKVLEITLRTDAALGAIERIIADVDGAIVGAGTVLNPKQFEQVEKLGCAFAVSPGFTHNLAQAASRHDCALLPGAATAAEIMQLMELGYERQKFFPAGPAGGVSYLKAISAPIPQVKFCPTGGVGPNNAVEYLALSNVLCVGGSWVAPDTLIDAGDWQGITDIAAKAAELSTA